MSATPPVVLPIARAPAARGDPRAWAVAELFAQPAGAGDPVLVASTGEECWHAVDLPRELHPLAEAALLDLPDVRWTASWGTALVRWEGRPVIVSFARVRWPEGTAYVEAWPRGMGLHLDRASSERYEGPADAVPPRLAELVPRLAPAPVRFEFEDLAPVPWPDAGDVRAPDAVHPTPEGARAVDAAQQAAHHLEARFATERLGLPAVVAWGEHRIALWWARDEGDVDLLQRLAWSLARDPRTLGVGLFGLGEDVEGGTHLPMIALVFEPRDEPTFMWLRRFRPVADDEAEWVDEVGLVRGPVERIGWFER